MNEEQTEQAKASEPETKTEKMLGIRLDAAHQQMLAEILDYYRRSNKAQVDIWIEQEHRYITRER